MTPRSGRTPYQRRRILVIVLLSGFLVLDIVLVGLAWKGGKSVDPSLTPAPVPVFTPFPSPSTTLVETPTPSR